MKEIRWIGTSLQDLRKFSEGVRQNAGYQLDKVQRGFEPSDWKPMKAVGKGVNEIRLRDESGQFRVIYLAMRKEAVYVLHAFQKKTQKTSLRDIKLASERLKEVPDE